MFELLVVIQDIYKLLLFNVILYPLLLILALMTIYCIWSSKIWMFNERTNLRVTG